MHLNMCNKNTFKCMFQAEKLLIVINNFNISSFSPHLCDKL